MTQAHVTDGTVQAANDRTLPDRGPVRRLD